MFQVSGGAYSGESEVEAVLILISYRTESQAAVFNAEAAAVPVVGGLDAAILQGVLDEVVTGVDTRAQPSLGRVSVPQQQPQLVVLCDLAGELRGKRAVERLKGGISNACEDAIP